MLSLYLYLYIVIIYESQFADLKGCDKQITPRKCRFTPCIRTIVVPENVALQK